MINITPEKVTEFASDDSEVILSVEGVSKKFCRDLKRSLFYGIKDITSDLSGIRQKKDRLRNKEFWALNDVTFELKKGEALGLVGKNGSGKSTLLRIIAGLIKPDIGSVQVTGRVAPLIALGAGFNPILTGRENIYANMSILGLSTKQIDERFDDVVEFAEIGDAIDSPVQTYSSGMAARLGFASAIHTEPDILLIDEVLAVGDIKFKQKCQRRLSELRQKGISFILVSHQSQSILNVCETAVYLSKGKFISHSDAVSVINQYEHDLFVNAAEDTSGKLCLTEKSKDESLGLDIISIFFKDKHNLIESPTTGAEVDLCVEVNSHKDFEFIYLFVAISAMNGNGEILVFSSFNDQVKLKIDRGKNTIQVHLPYIGLVPGTYSIKLLIREDPLSTLDYVESFKFNVVSEINNSHCLFYQPREWKVE